MAVKPDVRQEPINLYIEAERALDAFRSCYAKQINELRVKWQRGINAMSEKEKSGIVKASRYMLKAHHETFNRSIYQFLSNYFQNKSFNLNPDEKQYIADYIIDEIQREVDEIYFPSL